MIVAQWAACVMLAGSGCIFAIIAGGFGANERRGDANKALVMSALAIAAAIAVRP